MLPVDLILLAIQAGVRLYSGMREAYVASIKQAPITLPLPRAPVDDVSLEICVDFIVLATPPTDPGLLASFKEQQRIVGPLRTTFRATRQLPFEQERLVRTFHDRWFPLLNSEGQPGTETPIDPAKASSEAALSLLSVRQWAADQPGAPAAAWQIAIGTLIDVAVFWFANEPGAVATNRPEGKALRAFLQSLENVDFAHTTVATIATDLMVAVLDTVASQPKLIVGGKREEALVTAVTTAMAGAIQKIPPATLDSLDTLHTEQLSAILQTVAAATLRAGVDTVLNDPKLFYVDTPDGPRTKVVEQVGKALADLALPTAAGGQAMIDLAAAVSSGGLETLARAALAAVGNNPAILHLDGDTEKRLSPLLADLATSFSKATLPATTQAAFAEVAAVVVQATDRHMDTLWPNNSNDPAQNLARSAVVATLDTLATIGAGDGFSAFTTKDVVAIANAAIAAVADNPALMNIRAGSADPYLKAALLAMLQSLKQQSVATLSGEDVVTLLTAGLNAAVRKLPLLQNSGIGSSMVLGGVLDAAFEALREIRQNGSDAAKWQATGSKFVLDVIKTLLESIGELPGGTALTNDKLTALKAALIQFIAGGKPLAALPQLVSATKD
jgi:hypothetical protein